MKEMKESLCNKEIRVFLLQGEKGKKEKEKNLLKPGFSFSVFLF